MMLNCLYWSVWSIIVMKEEEETDHTIFHWELCRINMELYEKEAKLFGYSL